MALKPKGSVICAILAVFAAFAASIVVGAWLCLPGFIEDRIASQLGAVAGVDAFSFRVRRIGPGGIDLADLRVGDPDRPALQVESLRADYRLDRLLRGHIDRVVLSGVDIRVDFVRGRPVLPGIDPAAIVAGLKPAGGAPVASSRPPVTVGRLALRHVTLHLKWRGRDERIPLSVTVVPDDRWERIDLVCRAYPREQETILYAGIDTGKDWGRTELSAPAVDLSRFADLLSSVGIAGLEGHGRVTGRFDFHLSPFRFLDVDLDGGLDRAAVSHAGVRVETDPGASSSPAIGFRAFKAGDGPLSITLSAPGLSLDAPVPVWFSDIDAQATVHGGRVQVSGRFAAMPGPPPDPSPDAAPWRSSVPVAASFSGIREPDGGWTGQLISPAAGETFAEKSRWQAGVWGLTAAGRLPRVRLSGRGQGAETTVDYSLSAADLIFERDNLQLRLPAVQAKGRLTAKALHLSGATLDMKLTGAILGRDHLEALLPKLSATVQADPDGGRIQGVLTVADASLSDRTQDLRLEGIDARLPFGWPVAGASDPGVVTVSRMLWKDQDMGVVTAAIRQEGVGVGFSGSYESLFLPGLALAFSGRGGVSEARTVTVGIDLAVPAFLPAEGIDLSRVVPAAKGVRLQGTLTASGHLDIDAAGLGGRVTAEVRDGVLTLADKDLVVSGIDAALTLDDLPRLRSAPDQRITFARARIGAIDIADGRIAFQIESGKTLLMEGAEFGWCGGRIYGQAGRFQPGAEAHMLTLYCDRLKLARVLGELSSVRADGGGTVSGRIPLRFDRGRLFFDDGFLFSTPGEGGKIHVTGTDMLTAGIPPETAPYAQLDLARAALEDYDYQWAKLNLSTEGENLHLRMQMDGQPGAALPFVYDKTLGGFARVSAKSPGSHFQGIGLDVNFRLPLDQILHYGNTLKDGLRMAP
ncbi:MAG: YdbH domain-containing protein [Desulfobacterales bacterium]|nr:YdbH domain-containing protein [Desulfobacterales bacterium]